MKTSRLTMAAVALAAIAIGTSACKKEPGNVDQQAGERVINLNFTTKAMSDVMTRATASEDRLDRIAVFGLDASGKVAQTFDIIESPAATGNALTVSKGVISLRVIANPKGEQSLNYNTAAQLDQTKVDLTNAPASPFVMSGSTTVPAQITGALTVDLTRSIAKLVVKGNDGFTVSSVAVSRTPSYGYVFPQTQTPTFADTDYTGYAEVSGNEVYVGENNATDPTRLAVKGTYKGKEIVYNVTLQKNKAPIAVVRNTTYEVNVTPIDESNANVDVNVIDWSNVVVDNGYFDPNSNNYRSVDFHNHTGFTDGENPITFVLNQAMKYGLDIIVNSEHGGSDPHNASEGTEEGMYLPTWTEQNVTPEGTPNNGKMWRWQSIMQYSWPKVREFNGVNSLTTLAVQGLEWNPPGHEHCSAGVVTGQFDGNDNARAMAQFEYMFDNNDNDMTGGDKYGWTKSAKTEHAKSVEGAAWMQKNHPHTGWLVPAHPERQNRWSIEHYRELNDVAPDVFVGFESIPGHQAAQGRGGYGNSASYEKTYTFGGTGVQSAKVGGLWDAMISEGRRFWLVANSDFHKHVDRGGGDFYPGEYQKTYISMNNHTAQGFVDGLRAGNIYNVHGDLIDKLQFSVGSATMGQTLVTSGNQVTVTIVVRDPDAANNNTFSGYTNPVLDHIDLIAGDMRPKVSSSDPEYKKASYDAVRVIARFDAIGGVTDTDGITSTAWTDMGDGFRKITYTYTITGDTYFRLRGTNHGLNVAGETDGAGNPLVDTPTGSVLEGAISAFSDLWFYSNPIFVRKN